MAKFSVPPLSSSAIGVSFAVFYLALAGLFLIKGLRIDLQRVLLLSTLLIPLFMVHASVDTNLGIKSILFFFAIHIPYLFHVAPRDRLFEAALETFQKIGLIIGCCGIVQFFSQFVIGGIWAYPIESFLPSSYFISGYNTKIPVSMGSEIYKANGIFMLEPSFYSQLMAITLLAELCTGNRILHIGLLGLALVLAVSGTGLIILAICLPVIVVKQRRWDLLLIGLVIALLVVTFSNSALLAPLLGRMEEFGNRKSSGFARFIGGFYLFDQFLWSDSFRTFFGYGPGSYKILAKKSTISVGAEMALFKIVLEYGIVGATMYFSILQFIIFKSPAPFPLRLAVASSLFLNGPYSDFFHGIALSTFVWTYGSGSIMSTTVSEDQSTTLLYSESDMDARSRETN